MDVQGNRAGKALRHRGQVRARTLIASVVTLATFSVARAEEAPGEKTTYADHVLPVFRNTCLNCHNPDKKKAGLDLSTYQSMMSGSDSGKVIDPGNSGNSLLFKLVTHAEEPTMPPKADKLPDAELAIIKKFIDGFALETLSSKAEMKQAGATPALVEAEGKASGPGPMPEDLSLEPYLRTARPGAVTALDGSPRSPLVAIAGQKQVLLYHAGTLELMGILPFPEGFPDVVHFSRNGQVLLAGGGRGAHSGKVVLWDVVTGQRVLAAGDEFDVVLAADISADHSLVALGGPGKLVKIFSGNEGKLLHSMKKHTDWVTALAFSADGKLLASGDRASGLVVWESANGQERFTLAGHKAAITGLSCSSTHLASSSEDGTVKLWDLKEGKEVKSWEAHKGGTLAVRWADGGRLVTCGRDKIVKLWDATGKQLHAFEPMSDVALQAALNSEKVFGSDWSGAIKAWHVGDGKIAGELVVNPPPVAEQLHAAQQTLVQLEPRHRQAAEALAAADNAMQAATQQVDAAKKSENEAQARVKTAETELPAFTKALEEAKAKFEQTRTQLAQQEQGNQEELTKALAAATAEVEKANVQVVATTEALNKAKADAEAATKALAAAAELVKTTTAQMAPAQQAATAAAQQLAQARGSVAKWTAALANVAVHAAKKTLADRQAEAAALIAAAGKMMEPATKAAADVTALEKGMTEGPERLKKQEVAIGEARKVVEVAQATTAAAEKTASERETLVQLSSDLAAKITAEAVKTAENKAFAEAAEKAKSSAELLKEELRKTKEMAGKKAEEMKQATEALAAAEKSFAQQKQELETAPTRLQTLRDAAQVALTKATESKTAADQQVAVAQKKVSEAEAEVTRLTAEYHTLRGQVPPPEVPPAPAPAAAAAK